MNRRERKREQTKDNIIDCAVELFKEIRNDIPLVIMARNLMLMYMNFFIYSIYGNENFETEHIKNQLIKLFLNGAKNQSL